ncbi:hypothetical protein ASD64_01460 [Mesorhizobium sp. Root157]|nr:hypothetical protein ASD64_01460 [Mesorhizobium sp. Root157]
MLDLAKSLKGINDATVRNTVAIELTEKIIAAHAAQAALISKVADLEKELVRFETWEAEKQRYDLHEIKKGRFTRRLKESVEGSEPPHHICAQCYNRGVKSILQSKVSEVGRNTLLVCGECKTELNLSLAV